MGTIHRLQYLRGLAAMLVVLSHGLIKVDRICEIQGWPQPGLRIDGTFGVDIFFVISGFLMCVTASGEFGQPGATGRFMLRRVIRIVPLYWLFIAIEVLLRVIKPDAAGTPFGATEVLLSMLFIPYGLQDGMFRPVVGLGWSLNYEMFFYSLFALGLVLRRDLGLLVIGLGMIGLVGLGHATQPEGTIAVAWTAPLLLEFLLGVGLGRLYLAARQRGRLLPIPYPFVIAIGLAVIEMTFFPGTDSEALGWRPLHWGVAGLIVAVNVFAIPDRRFEQTRLALFLKAVGDSSYSLYLGHGLVLTITARIWITLGFGREWLPAYFVLAVLSTIPAAWLLYRWIERPVTAALSAWLVGRPPRTMRPNEAVPPLSPVA
ncbi:acyltransferase family protein [Enterovirga rhinocerotis]|uniref:Peptidoglycan/LPS O-acetylase OafA/YrhL n=1 Tax=Enterovirga rhinocerotis TaxID=1339210 RepID=A0A4R7CCD7_9HYPH|nr:acyltransferase [Enterovirga rhinocerotis]TDR94467.1 peptidoglycan/LPS O-acetylase OafA/YrhL [Enterovirga rhinocerotis]